MGHHWQSFLPGTIVPLICIGVPVSWIQLAIL